MTEADRTLFKRLKHRLDRALEGHLPEQRLFLKSATDTRFVRLAPSTQALAIAVFCLAVGWMMFASAMVLMSFVASGSRAQDYARQVALYEQRLTAVAAERDTANADAASAQRRFNTALNQVSAMQSRLLASEDRRRELEKAVEVIQSTLRRVIVERDAARASNQAMAAVIAGKPGAATAIGHAADTAATAAFLSKALTRTAEERDAADAQVKQADAKIAAVEKSKRDLMSRDTIIFTKLEDALNVSVKPLDTMFRKVGLNPKKILASVRSAYSGEGGPLSPVSFSPLDHVPSPEQLRANAILAGLKKLNLYSIAAYGIPLGLPLRNHFVYTSPFGARRDPFTGKMGFHPGIDMASGYGTPVYATSDGTVIYARWMSGYGRLVEIQDSFGIQTLFGHLSQIRVHQGEKVSRGQRIGDMGDSGYSTGTHLHYEVRVDGRAVNPMTFIRAASNVF